MGNPNPPPNKRVLTVQEVSALVKAYKDGSTTSEIGVSMGMSDSWVANRLKENGVTLRGSHARVKRVDMREARKGYVKEQKSMTEVAQTLGVPASTLRKALVSAGIPIRRNHVSVSREALEDLYVQQKMTPTQIAERLGVRTAVVYAALDRCSIARHTLDISNTKLNQHLQAGLSDTEIAELYGVKAWNVRQQCRQAGLQRPPGGRFASTIPDVPESLNLLQSYVKEGKSLTQIATQHQVSTRTVKLWLESAGVEIRTAGRNTRPPPGAKMTPAKLRKLHEKQEWTAAAIAAHFGRSKKVVIMAMHNAGIAVRRGSGATRTSPVPLLTALYSDASVRAALRRHQFPLVETFGTLNKRFPNPPDLTADLVSQLYNGLGLSLTHIELLTGHHDSEIRRIAQLEGLRLRDGGRSPWEQNNRSTSVCSP